MNGRQLFRYTLLAMGLAAWSAHAAQTDEDSWFDGNSYQRDEASGLDLDLSGEAAGAPYYHDQSTTPTPSQWSDSTWPRPSQSPDLYEHNIWDPWVQNYGWYYQWNPQKQRWVRQYGWHTGEYESGTIIDRQRQERQNRGTQSTSQRRVIHGTIQDVQNMNLTNPAGTQAQHRVAKITLESGQTVLVDVADERQNGNIQLDQGDSIRVAGRVGKIDKRRVLFANSVQVGDRTINIHREGHPRAHPSVSISGTVQEVTPFYMNDEFGRRHKFAEIVLDNGTVSLVDLRDRSILDLDMGEGDFVRVQGTRDQISGRNFIRASRVTVNGNQTTLTRG